MQSARTGDQPGSLRRMWFRFQLPRGLREAAERNGGRVAVAAVLLVGEPPFGVFTVGCGVTGYDEDDCLALVREEVFHGRPLPEILNRVADIDVSTVPEHLQQHLGNPVSRGVWFPPLSVPRSGN